MYFIYYKNELKCIAYQVYFIMMFLDVTAAQ